MKIKNDIKLYVYHFRGRHKASPYTMRRVFCYGVLAFLLAGCTIDDSTEKRAAEQEMQLTITRADDASLSKATFLFWYATDLTKIGGSATPYHVALPTGEVDDYKDPEPKYATGKPYPVDYSQVAAIGYSPRSLEMTNDYATLTIPNTEIGTCDALTANPVYGSVAAIFSDHLEFGHAQAKVFFKAIRKKEMVNFVKYVRVEVGYPQLMQKIEWSATDLKYKGIAFAEPNAGTVTIAQDPGDNMLSACLYDPPSASEDYRDVGTLYIAPDKGSMTINVIAQIALPAFVTDIMNPAYETRVQDVEITFKGPSSEDIILKAGDSYEVIIVFEDGAFTIIGRKAGWEHGGNIVLPVPIW